MCTNFTKRNFIHNRFRHTLSAELRHTGARFEYVAFAELLVEAVDESEVDDLSDQVRAEWEDLEQGLNRIIFVTEEGHVGALYHLERKTAVGSGDILVGLFGIRFPFVLRPLFTLVGSK